MTEESRSGAPRGARSKRQPRAAPIEKGESDTAPPLRHPAELDVVLQALVDTVNHGDTEFPLTLSMGGMIVTGTLVSGRKFFDGLAAEFAEASPSAKTVWRKSFRLLGSAYYPASKQELSKSPPHYFHLRDAHFLGPTPAPIPTNRGVWWRGRIVRVDGFFFGTLTSNP